MQKVKKLAIITTHPIQYYAPVFKLISESGKVDLKVFYTWGEDSLIKHDPGFGRIIEWDIPLLEGYKYEFLSNTAKDQGSHHFMGIKNPTAISQIDRFEPDVILIYGWSWNSHLKAIMHYKGKIPLWFRGDSTLLDQKKSFKNQFRKVFLKWVYTHFDKAFYVGNANKDYFLNNGLKEHQLIYAPHAVENSRFEINRNNDAAALREELKLSKTDILILFAGKLESKKDPLLLLKAFTLIENLNIHLLFVGNGLLEKSLKEKVKDQNLKRVYFRDFQNQQSLPAYYHACNLFCLPSSGPGETWGLAINEAMACGKAVLVSDKVGCAINLVKPGINGEIFQSNDVYSLAEKITVLTDIPRKLVEYGAASQKIIKVYDFQYIADSFIKEMNNKQKRF